MTRFMVQAMLLVGMMMLLILTACNSNVKRYQKSLPKNLTIKLISSSGSIFKSVHASLDIYSLDPNCNQIYEGRVEINNRPKIIGLKQNQYSYLVFHFKTKVLRNYSTIKQSGYLLPRSNYKYVIRMSYKDKIYNVAVSQFRDGLKHRKIKLKIQKPCK